MEISNNTQSEYPPIIFYRAKDDVWIAGVCSGIAKKFDLPVWLVRLVWFFSSLPVLGIGVYILLIFSLPREDRLSQAFDAKILGVCSKLSRKFDIDIGIVRFLFLLFVCSSFGLAVLAYVVLHFSLEEGRN